jgi:hypothetical protein
MRNSLVLPPIVLLGALVVEAGLAHQALIEACVCVVNAMSRGMVAAGVALLLALVAGLVTHDRGSRVATALSALALLTAVFFTVQHAFFLLEVVR